MTKRSKLDLSGEIIRADKGSIDTTAFFHGRPAKADPPAEGEPWPERFSAEILRKMRERLSLEFFGRLYREGRDGLEEVEWWREYPPALESLCETCAGEGECIQMVCYGGAPSEKMHECPVCGGTGTN